MFSLGKKKYHQEFHALSNVCLAVQKGQTVGIIGRNGAGKSTLLELIAGTSQPTRGIVEKAGRVGALLELGSGFSPEFTGWENVRINAAILGLGKRELDEKMDEIIKFADIGAFIDRPLKMYSSGMIVRLAFAVQACLEPSILIVDEALAVGDESFQKKCFDRLRMLKSNGTSILLVSHSCSQVNQHCDYVYLLDRGQILLEGKPHDVTKVYQRLLRFNDYDWKSKLQQLTDTSKQELTNSSFIPNQGIIKSESLYSYDNDGVDIKSIEILGHRDCPTSFINTGQDFKIRIIFEAFRLVETARIACFIADKDGERLCGQAYPTLVDDSVKLAPGLYEIKFKYHGGLWDGKYYIGAGVSDTSRKGVFLHRVIDGAVLCIVSTQPMLKIGRAKMQSGLLEPSMEKIR